MRLALSLGERRTLNGPPGTGRMRTLTALRPLSLLAMTAALLWPGLQLGATDDAAIFALEGSRIRDGFMPYRDLWDSKPPGSYLLNAMGQMGLPWLDPWLVSWLLTLVFTLASVLLIDDLLRRLSPGASWAWSLLCCIGVACYPIGLGGGYTELFALLPLVAALWAIAVLPRDWRTTVGIGLGLGCAFLLSLQSLPAIGALALAAVWNDGPASEWRRRATALVVGGIAVPLVVLVWLLVGGAGRDAVDQLLTYNVAYGEAGGQLLVVMPIVILLLAWLAIPTGIQAARLLRRPRSFGRVDWLCLAWGGAYALYVCCQGRIFLHYLILVVPPLILLGSQGTNWLWARVRSPNPNQRSLAMGLSVAGVGALMVSASLMLQWSSATLGQVTDDQRVVNATAGWIRANTSGAATMHVWGGDAMLYLDTQRPPADRFVDDFPMVASKYWTADRTNALIADWRASPPTIIVEGPSTAPLFRPAIGSTTAGGIDQLSPLRDFVRAHYRLAISFGVHDAFDDVYLWVAA